MPDKSPRQKLKELENKSRKEQHDFLAQYEKKFVPEPVSSKSPNVKKGDHIRFRHKSYDHHAVCLDVDDNEVTLMEYTGPASGYSAVSQSVSSSDFGRLGGVKESKFPYSVLVDKNAEIIVWPDELKRFTPEEIVKRSQERKDENYYSLVKNNCEHFVTWCICGLMVSLQVKDWHIVVKELVFSVIHSKPFAVVAANVFDEIGMLSCGKLCFWIGALIEVGIASYELWEVYKQYNDPNCPLIRTKKDVTIKIIEILLKGILRFGLGYLGSCFVIGRSFFSILQSLVCGAVCGAGGHLLAVRITLHLANLDGIVNGG